VAASRSVGQPETLGATIRKRQEDGSKKSAHNLIELKEAGLGLMDRVRANGHLMAVLKGLPLNPLGIKKQQHELIAKTPCTLLYSFSLYMESIQSPAKALGSLLQRSELDTEAKEIVRAMMRLRSEYCAANYASRKVKKLEGGSRKKEG